MDHSNPMGLTSKQVDLMVSKLIDIARRPRVKGKQGAPQRGAPRGAQGDQQQWKAGKKAEWDNWVPPQGGAGKNAADKPPKKRTYKCANCGDPDHSQQECDPDKYPNIHDFCWKCNTHGHNATGCRGQPTLEQWEAQAEKECIKAVAENRPWFEKYQKPLTGVGKRADPNATGRNAGGGKEWVSWTKAELNKRQETKGK